MIRLNTVAHMGDGSVQSDTWVKPELIEVVSEPIDELKAHGVNAVVEIAGRGTWCVQQCVEDIINELSAVPVVNKPNVIDERPGMIRTPNAVAVRESGEIFRHMRTSERIKHQLKTLPKEHAVFLMRKFDGRVTTLPASNAEVVDLIKHEVGQGHIVLFTNIEGVNPAFIDSTDHVTYAQFMNAAAPWLRNLRSLIWVGGGQ